MPESMIRQMMGVLSGRARRLGLLPKNISELEFTVDNGKVKLIEYWTNIKRRKEDKHYVTIPTCLASQFNVYTLIHDFQYRLRYR